MSDRATGARRQKASPSQICIAEAMQAPVWARPVEYGRVRGDKGACPLGLPPPLGESGGHPRNCTECVVGRIYHERPSVIHHVCLSPRFMLVSTEPFYRDLKK